MEFKDISEVLADKNLKNPSFDFLIPDHDLYSLLLYQPSHEFEAQPTYLRSSDRDLAKEKVSSFLEIAIQKNVSLVITPEYSCPWETITESIIDNNLPQEDCLWALGCESILPENFQELVNEHNEIAWIYDEDLINNNLGRNNFLNPLCYLFKTRDGQGDLINIITVQFKTYPLGGIPYERDNMISGNDIYVFANEGEDSITLRTFICSDTINPNVNNEVTSLSKITPHLFLHIQLNNSPCHENFRGYRSEIFRYDSDSREVICLNWGRDNNRDIERKFGASALYTKISSEGQPELSHDRVNSNHKSGLYYTWSKGKKNNFYFNFDEYVFYLRNTKASQAVAAGPMTKRTGPELLETFAWNNDQNWALVDQVDDGFRSLCESVEDTDEHIDLELLKSDDNLTPVDKELLLTLTIGKANRTDWYKFNKGEFFYVGTNEHIKRFTFVHHPNRDVIINRKTYLLRYAKLENQILKNEDKFPDSISDLKGNCKISYESNNSSCNFNLYPINDGPNTTRATGIYLDVIDRAEAERVFNQVKGIFGERKKAKNDSQNDYRIVVWYKNNNDEIQFIEPKGKPGPLNKKKDRRSISRKAG